MGLVHYFPDLNDENHKETSDPTDEYNCIAWAAGYSDAWWDPSPMPQYYWPEGLPLDDSIDTLVKVFESLGYAVCNEADLKSALDTEPGIEKVALYGDDLGYTHAARQLPDGKWTSKLGGLQDIEHDSPAILCGKEYGMVQRIMKRDTKTES